MDVATRITHSFLIYDNKYICLKFQGTLKVFTPKAIRLQGFVESNNYNVVKYHFKVFRQNIVTLSTFFKSTFVVTLNIYIYIF